MALLAGNIDYLSIFESVPDPCLVLDPQFYVADVNKAYLDATMTTRENIVGRYIFDIFPDNPNDPNATGVKNLRASLERVLKSRRTDAMAVQKYDIRKPVSEGGTFEVRYWSPINAPVFGADGELAYIIHRVQDVTGFVRLRDQEVGSRTGTEGVPEQAQAVRMSAESYNRAQEVAAINLELKRLNEELDTKNGKLQELNDRLSKIFNNTPSILTITTLDGKIIDVNEAGLKTAGYERSEVIGRMVHEFHAWENPEDRDKVIKLLEENGSVRDLEVGFRTKSGAIANILFSAQLIEIDNTRCILSLGKDITERKRWEDALVRANQDLEAFNYTVAHDLRQPLNIIFGYCQAIDMFCGDSLDGQCKQFLHDSHDGILRMNKLIDSLLEFARLSRVELQRESVDLSALARAVVEELRKVEPERKGVTFRIAEGMTAYGDPDLLRIVLANLFGNAWKYTAAQPEALIEFGTGDKETGPAYFVRDNGAGFDMAEGGKLFAPFQRLTGAEKGRGFGIGLATVERIIVRHGGRVWAEGEVGRGSTFYFTLPS